MTTSLHSLAGSSCPSGTEPPANHSWLADEAGRSPIVSDRGSRNQWIYGAGAIFLVRAPGASFA